VEPVEFRKRLVNDPGSIGGRLRARRWAMFAEHFPDFGNYRVVDLGGTAGSWLLAPMRPKELVVVNLVDSELSIGVGEDVPDWIHLRQGDACEPPDVGACDLVYSNSLIEHLGGPARRAQFADVVHGMAPRHWIQTPYRYFPIEPHWLFPGFQFLPLNARGWLTRCWPLTHVEESRNRDEAIEIALSVDLLSVTEMRHLFPRSSIVHERVGPMTKSIVAVAS
jgi:hypothetical protein